MDSVAALTSISLQYGVPLDALVRKFSHQRFEPSGFTKNPQIGRASSIIDYVFRWMGSQFIPGFVEKSRGNGAGQQELNIPGLQEQQAKQVNKPVVELPVAGSDGESIAHAPPRTFARRISISQSVAHFMEDAPTCPTCGNVTVRNGACFKCLNCGESLGCS